jgi:hypothetical protein
MKRSRTWGSPMFMQNNQVRYIFRPARIRQLLYDIVPAVYSVRIWEN